MIRQLYMLLLLCGLGSKLSAQQVNAVVWAKVTDETGVPLEFAVVKVFQDGKYVAGSNADEYGECRLEVSLEGEALVKATYAGMTKEAKTSLARGTTTRLEFVLNQQIQLELVVIRTDPHFSKDGKR